MRPYSTLLALTKTVGNNFQKMKKDLDKEVYYFKQRNPEKIYVSKAFPYLKFRGVLTTEKRYIKKVFDKERTDELVEVNGEIILRESSLFNKKYQVSAVVYSRKDTNLLEFVLQKFIINEEQETKPVTDSSFSFSQEEFTALLKFLSDLKFLDFSDKNRFVVEGKKIPNHKILLNLSKPDPNKVLVDKNLADLVDKLKDLKDSEREQLLETLRNNILTKEDLDILSGRKDGLAKFKENLKLEKKPTELEWQKFFEKNSWIFGYGLDYKFLNILQREASVSSTDVDGTNQVNADFLLADNNFTVIVELKRPDTLLYEKEKNRSESWRLSKDLTYAVSQILSQKAEWEIKAQSQNFREGGKLITQTTIDPKTILVIGNTEQFSGNNKEDLIKKKTFELYRRNLRNIEIVTFDELLERAQFIVSDNNDNSSDDSTKEDDLPF